ncbi:Major facilitator superfamily domain-containing protein 9, partial [Operophtera brumata]
DLFAVSLIIPLVPSHVRAMGGNHICVGLLGSLYNGFQLGSGPLMGSLSDIKGRKLILIMSLLLCSVGYVVIGFTNSIIVILIARGFLGLFKQTQMLTKAMVPDYEANVQKQGEIYGRMMAISGVGITVGPIIGGHIAEDYREYAITYISVIVGVAFLINAGMVFFLPTAIYSKTQRKSSNVPARNLLYSILPSLKQSFVKLYNIKWSHYWDAFLLKGLVGFAMGTYYSNYGVYLRTQYVLSPKYVGYIISFHGMVGSIASYYMGFINSFYIHDKDYSQRNFHAFLLMTTSMLGMILSINVYSYTVCLIPLAIGNAVSRLITLEMVLKRCHGDHRGSLIGASNSVRSLSGVLSPMVAGLIAEYIGVSYVIYASLLATLSGVILSYQIKHKRLKVD